MTEDGLTVLLVEDNAPDAVYIEELFDDIAWPDRPVSGESFGDPGLRHVETLADCETSLSEECVDIVLLDLNLPDSRGLATVEAVLDASTGQAVVVLTGLDDERVGVEAVERGAQDYLVKDEVNPTLLGRTIQYAVERHRRERQLERRNEELTLLNRLVRHDIRDDMALIRGWGQTVDPHVDSDGEEHLERMLEASNHVIDLTETVGEFLETLQDREEATLRPYNLQGVLGSELEKARSVHEGAVFELDGAIPTVEVAATQLLSSVFRNLLANAVQHNDSDPPVVRVGTAVDDDTVTVTVADNGPGVPASKRDAIFGRTESGLANPETGVGLYLVDTLVDLYGGSVTVRDNDPRGSVFEVTLQRVVRGDESAGVSMQEGRGDVG